MHRRRSVLAGSVSVLAVAAMAAPAFAQTAGDANTVKEVVVTGIRGSLQKAIDIKRKSDDIVDAISAEDIGKLPDRNVADALQRIPGVNTFSAASGEGGFDENDRVSIRGTPASLTNVTVDGHSVSTGDWFILDQFQTVGRSVSFTLLPSEIVNNLVVDKSQNASLLEGGVAGSIDIQTRTPLSMSKPITMEASFEGAYNSLTGTTKPQVSALFGWKNADDTFGVLAQGFYEERDVRRYGQEVLGWTGLTAANPLAAAHPELIGAQYPTLIGSSLFEQQRRREGGDVVLQYRPNDQFEVKLDGFYSDLNATNHNDNYMMWGSQLFQTMPTSYTVKNNTITAADFATGGPMGGAVVDNIIRPNAEARTYFVNLDTKIRPNDRLTLTGQIGFTQGEGLTPTEPAFEVDAMTGASYHPSGNGFAVNFNNIDPSNPAGLANDWAWNETFKSIDKEVYAKFDGDYKFDDSVFKSVDFGVRYANHDRRVDGWDRGCSLGGTPSDCWGAPATPFSAVNPTSYPSGYNGGALGIPGLLIPIAGDPNAIINLMNSLQNPLRGPISHIVNPQCSTVYQGQTYSCAGANYYFPGAFHVHENDWAGYLMAHVGGDRWRGNFGARIVDTDLHSYVNFADTNPGPLVDVNCNGPTFPPSPSCTGSNPADVLTSAYGPYYVNNVHHNYLDVLPSANFTFDLRRDLLLRVSAAETMSRPDFSALGGSVSLTDSNLTGNGGNPNLKPIKSANYDASLEWYYAPQSSLSLALYYMDLQSYVSYGNVVGTYYSEFYHANKQYSITEPFNTTGKVQGFELQWQQPIGHTGFGFLANYTYSDSEDANGNPIVGNSKNTFNATGYYENKWVSARLAYTYRSHFLVGLDRSSAENQDDVGSLDASVNFNVTPNVTITAQGLNLTDDLLKYYGQNRTQIRAVYENGTQAYFGVRFKY
jgi:iron complex outermembrane receptor protein